MRSRLLPVVAALALWGPASRAADGGVDGGVARWQVAQGPETFGKGVTDLVELSVGSSVAVQFPQHVVTVVCDAPLAGVENRGTGLLFTGREAGVTHCGFWYFPNAFPQRYVEVRVSPSR